MVDGGVLVGGHTSAVVPAVAAPPNPAFPPSEWGEGAKSQSTPFPPFRWGEGPGMGGSDRDGGAQVPTRSFTS